MPFLFVATLGLLLLPDEAPPTKLHPKLQTEVRKARLENGLTVLVLSDPAAEKGAAALSVRAGSWEEPAKSPGLAHFLEHMLFMGTKTHPDEESFTQFITESNGSTNAFTEDLYTTYLFETDPQNFPEALSLFGEFFKEPLLKDSGAAREMRAVDQEFLGQSQNDEVRRLMVYKELGNPEHPFSKFSFGNSDTLAAVKGAELREWFEERYSSNLMTLVLYSPLPADEVLKAAEKVFAPIPNRNLSPVPHPGPLLSRELRGKVLYIEPLQNKRSLILMWELPPQFVKAKDKRPEELLCLVLGHEGKNSLFDHLREEGLALGIACDVSAWQEENSILLVEVQLTEEGLEKKWEVVDRVFETLSMIQKNPYPKGLFDEIHEMGLREYSYPNAQTPFQEVMRHSRALREEKIETYPFHSKVIQQFDPTLVQQLAASLTPDSLFLSVLAKGREFSQEETWMGVPYQLEPIPPQVLDEWRRAVAPPSLEYPTENPFLDDPLSLLYRGEPEQKSWETPTELAPGLYYAPDHHFLVPQTYLSFLIRTPEVDTGDPVKVILNQLFAALAMHKLQDVAYLARMAGLYYEIKVEDFGIRITLTGFSGKELLFLEKILEELKKAPSESLFTLYKKEGQKELENFPLKPSYEQGINLLKSATFKRYSSPQEKLKAIEGITYASFLQHVQNLFSKNELLGFALGNLSEQEALTAFEKIKKEIGGAPIDDKREQEVALFPEGPFFLQQQTESRGNGVILAIENMEDSPKRYAAGAILSDLLQTPFFNELRTKQQTAYLITNLYQEVNQVLLHLFLLESHTHSSRDLLARIELFLSNFLEEGDLEARFEKGRAGVIAKLSKNEENLQDAGKKVAALAFDRKGDFALYEKRLQGAKELTFGEFLQYAREFLSSQNRKRLAIFAEGIENPSILEYKDLPDPKAFQNKVLKWIEAPAP